MPLHKTIFGRLYALYAIVVFLLLLVPAYFLFRLVKTFSEPQNLHSNIHKAFVAWMDIYMPLIFCPVSKKGLHYFEHGKAYVVVINHNSLMDIPVSSPGIPMPNKTLGKTSFSKVPLFGFIYKLGSVLVDRGNARSRATSLIQLKQYLQQGISVCLYPEGTRNTSNDVLLPFHDGAFRLAIDAKVAVIPAIINGAKETLPAKGPIFWAWPHRIQFEFLAPISPADFASVEDLKLATRKAMLNALN
ncbi:MAG: hypothetical protein RL660_998 [Bacteroidota bacterium]|jgi:1-acyl-sn-glycerol-3-phosphate acyltransferase